MKRFVFLALFLCPFLIPAQGYLPFLPNETHLFGYRDFSDSIIHAIKVESVIPQGADTHYMFNRIHVEDGLNINLDRDNTFGERMVQKPGGRFEFHTINQDTFVLETQVPVSASWTWHDTIIATLQSRSLGTVLGQSDSILTISLSNQDQILLSQSHGLVACRQLVSRTTSPYDVYEYDLVGLQNLHQGDTLTGFDQMFDVSVPSLIQYQTQVCPDAFSPCADGYEDLDLTQKTATSQGWNYDAMRSTLEFIPILFVGIDTIYSPPVQYSLGYSQQSEGYVGELLPGEWDSTHIFLDINVMSNGAWQYNYQNHQFTHTYDSVTNALLGFESLRLNSFIPGIGLSEQWFYDSDYSEGKWLNCFVVGIDTQFVCFDIDAVVGVEDRLESLDATIYPQPFQTRFRIQGPEQFEGVIKVFDLQGQAKYQYTGFLDGGQHEIHTEGWANGIYLVEMVDHKGKVFRSKVLKVGE